MMYNMNFPLLFLFELCHLFYSAYVTLSALKFSALFPYKLLHGY
jgi:hypothetical protein